MQKYCKIAFQYGLKKLPKSKTSLQNSLLNFFQVIICVVINLHIRISRQQFFHFGGFGNRINIGGMHYYDDTPTPPTTTTRRRYTKPTNVLDIDSFVFHSNERSTRFGRSSAKTTYFKRGFRTLGKRSSISSSHSRSTTTSYSPTQQSSTTVAPKRPFDRSGSLGQRPFTNFTSSSQQFNSSTSSSRQSTTSAPPTQQKNVTSALTSQQSSNSNITTGPFLNSTSSQPSLTNMTFPEILSPIPLHKVRKHTGPTILHDITSYHFFTTNSKHENLTVSSSKTSPSTTSSPSVVSTSTQSAYKTIFPNKSRYPH